MTEFGTRLRELRAIAGMTQQELARKAGMSVTAIARMEQGWGDPSWRTALKLARALGVSLAEFDEAGEPEGSEQPESPPGESPAPKM